MSKKSQKSEQRRGLSRPFTAEIMAAAHKVACNYHVIIEQAVGESPALYIGCAREMPLVVADGPTVARCLKNTREALSAATAALLERGDRVPPPMEPHASAVEVGLRLTGPQMRVLASAARRNARRGKTQAKARAI